MQMIPITMVVMGLASLGCNSFADSAASAAGRAPASPETEKFSGEKHIPRLDGGARYITYYGHWTDAKLEGALSARLVIGDFSSAGITREKVQKFRRGLDGLSGTSDDVTVISYISPLEERDLGGGAALGDSRGPLTIDPKDGIVGHGTGYASYYVDAVTQSGYTTTARVPDGKPDRVNFGKGFRTNPADPAWRVSLRAHADDALVTQGADGLFLDVLDGVNPEQPYAALLPNAFETVRWLKATYPEKYLVANRGFFFFETNTKRWWSQYNIRPYISAVMLENQYTEWENGNSVWSKWAGYPRETPTLVAESEKEDGFRILVLDYINPSQPDCAELVSRQKAGVTEAGKGRWLNLLSGIHLDGLGFSGCTTP